VQALVARMSWWTAEYGLAGSLKNPKIYGAGLLSSVGESKLAMTDKVKKIPLSIDCINYSYNITEPQPQLFVAQDMQHLHSVLHELDGLLAYRIGGVSALKKLRDADAIGTVCLDSEIAISGHLLSFEHSADRVDFMKFSGPVQLTRHQKELSGQGIERHAEGFSSPIGRLQNRPDQALASLSDGQLKDIGISKGQRAHLRFVSGFEVRGVLSDLVRKDGKLILLTFRDCTVTKGSQAYFEPAWGEFDLVVGDSVPSVYGGPADREPYGEHEINEPGSTPGRETPYSADELASFKSYQKLRELRDTLHRQGASGQKQAVPELEKLAEDALQRKEWLLSLEIYELAKETKQDDSAFIQSLNRDLESRRAAGEEGELISEGLRLL
jgi:phenylalanine-4-hydroxylase